MTVARTTFQTPQTFTITLAGLASDANLSTGRIGAAVDNTAINPVPVDVLIGGVVSISSVSTTSGSGGKIEVWCAPSWDGTRFAGGASTADAAFSAGQEKINMKLLTAIMVSTTATTIAASSQSYEWGPYSLAQACGGTIPLEWNLFFTHNLTAALNGQSTFHVITYTPVNYASS